MTMVWRHPLCSHLHPLCQHLGVAAQESLSWHCAAGLGQTSHSQFCCFGATLQCQFGAQRPHNGLGFGLLYLFYRESPAAVKTYSYIHSGTAFAEAHMTLIKHCVMGLTFNKENQTPTSLYQSVVSAFRVGFGLVFKLMKKPNKYYFKINMGILDLRHKLKMVKLYFLYINMVDIWICIDLIKNI